MACVLRLSGADRGAGPEAEAFTHRPEPPLQARRGGRRTGTASGSAGTEPARRRGSSTASSRPGTTAICENWRRISNHQSCSRTSAPPLDRRSSRRTATLSVTAVGSGCTTGSSASSRRSSATSHSPSTPRCTRRSRARPTPSCFSSGAHTLGLEDDPPGAVERAVGLIEDRQTPRCRASDPDDGGHKRRHADLGLPPPARAVALALLSTDVSTLRHQHPDNPVSTRSPTSRGSSSRSRSATLPAPGTRFPSRPGASSARGRTSCIRLRRDRRRDSSLLDKALEELDDDLDRHRQDVPDRLTHRPTISSWFLRATRRTGCPGLRPR